MQAKTPYLPENYPPPGHPTAILLAIQVIPFLNKFVKTIHFGIIVFGQDKSPHFQECQLIVFYPRPRTIDSI